MSKSIVFVDSRIADYQTLLAGIPADQYETVLIDGSGEGLAQMVAALAGRSDLNSIHILSHGASGELQLGTTILTADNLGSYAEQLATIGSSLSATGDLLLYGCNVGAGETGQHFIDSLAHFTQADVAASTDLTGAAGQGGNWVLEAHAGTVETSTLIAQSSWDNLLGGGNNPPVFTDITSPGFGFLASPSGTTSVYGVTYTEAPDGTRYAAYMDWSNPAKVSVVKLVGNAWATVGNAEFGTAVNSAPLALTTGSDGTPYVMYLDSTTTKNVVMKLDGSSWAQVGSVLSAGGQTYSNSMAVDSSGNIYAAFSDFNASPHYSVIVKELAAGANEWTTVGSTGVTSSGSIQIAIAPDDTPYLVYEASSGMTSIPRVIAFDGNQWNQVGSDVTSGGTELNLVFAADGSPVVSYMDATSNYQLTVKEYTGGNWVQLGGLVSGDYPGSSSLAADPEGALYASYVNGGLLTVSKWNGTDWVEQWGMGSFDIMGGQRNQLYVSADGTVTAVWPDNMGSNHALADSGQPDYLAFSAAENQTAVGTLTVTDPDSDQVTLSITGGPDAAKFQLSGNDLVFINAPDYESPADVGGNNQYQIEITADDGNSGTTTAVVKVAVTDVNEGGGNTAPVNTIATWFGDHYAMNEGNILHINDLMVADDDGDTLTVTLSVNHGALNLPNINTSSGITALDADGLDGTISFSGSVNDINTMLGNRWLDYYAPQDQTGTPYATLTMTTDDGHGGSDTDSVPINVSAVNDAPTFTQAGGYWDGFSGGAEAYASVLQPDGKLIVVGWGNNETDMSGSTNYLEMVRLNPDGTVDDTFADGEYYQHGYHGAESVALQPDGKIVVVGTDDTDNAYIARFNSDGTEDTNFGSNDGYVNVSVDTNLDSLFMTKVVMQADGKILLVGTQNPEAGDGGDVALVRYNADGTLDTGFGTNGYVIQDLSGTSDGADAVTIDADGKIIVAGSAADDIAVVRFSADGSLDTSFDTDGIATLDIGIGSIDEASAIAIDANGKIVVAGNTDATSGGDYDIVLARFDADGSLDASFGSHGTAVLSEIHAIMNDLDLAPDNGDDYANSIALDASGNIYVGGQFGYDGENSDGDSITAGFSAFAKFDSSGHLDTSFGADSVALPWYVEYGYLMQDDSSYIGSVLVQTDGKIVTAGGDIYDDWGDVYDEFFVERFDSQGNYDRHFGNRPRDTVEYAYTEDFVEGGDPVTIGGRYAGGAPVIYDVEQHAADSYANGTLTIQRSGGANAEDLINFDSSGLSSAGITLEGTSAYTGNIKHGGSTFATFDFSDNKLVIHFVAGSTQALVDAVTANISYDNTNDVNPGGEDGYVDLDWTYSDGFRSVTSTASIGIEGDDDGGIEGTVTVTGTPTTGSTLGISGLNTVTDPDLAGVTDGNGTVPEDDMYLQWQVKVGENWENIDGATDSTYQVTGSEGGTQFRVLVGYEDATNGQYTELESAATGSSGSNGDIPANGGDTGGGTGGTSHETVDGVTLATSSSSTQTTVIDPTTGQSTTFTTQTQVTTVPIVTGTRAEQDHTTPNADVPLARDSSGATLIEASVPVGVGLSSEAIGSTGNTHLGLRDLLIAASEPRAGQNEFTSILQQIDTYVPSVNDEQQVAVRTITFNSTLTTPPGEPIVISGATGTGEHDQAHPDRQEALVLDVRNLPSGTVLQLNDVEFAIIIGATRVTGGEGQNFAVGDDAVQYIVLGADDDELRGGGGNDTVGSKGGDDRLYGDAGNDLVVGGIGNDRLFGGSGDDVLQGGSSDAGTWEVLQDQAGKTYLHFTAADGTLSQITGFTEESGFQYDLGYVPLADSRSAFLHSDMTKAETIALLYHAVLGRLPDNREINYWAAQNLDYSHMADLAYSAYESVTAARAGANSLETQVRQVIEHVWGTVSDEMVQTGIQYIEHGGSWAEGFLWLSQNDAHKKLLTDADGYLSIMQPLTLGETGWSANPGNNYLSGGDGNDRLIPGTGNNIIDGGNGTDIVVVTGNVLDYSLGLQADATGAVNLVLRNEILGSTNILSNVELAEIGGVVYGPKGTMPTLDLGEFKSLNEFVQIVGSQELQAMGVPSSWL